MRVLVVHHSLNSAGGGERVALHLIRLLQDMGHEVHLACVEKTNWDYVQKVIGVRLRYIPREHPLFPVRLRVFGIYQRALTSLHVLRFRSKFDLIINTHGDALVAPAHITYLHFPILAYVRLGFLGRYFKYYKSTFWRLYFEPYKVWQFAVAEHAYKNSVVLTNSRYSAYFAKKLFDVDAVVVYPPVEVDQYLKLAERTDREDAVIYIARYSPEKCSHHLIYVAKELPDVKFYLVGAAHGRGLSYYQYCLKLKERLNVKNIEILANVPHEDKLKLLARCKVYVHLYITEHFGIAPVEALASGCMLVVPVNSGTWTDVCEFGKYGIGYHKLDPRELAEKIQEAMNNWRKGFVQKAKEHVKKFSVDSFYERMRKVIEIFEQEAA